MADIEMREASPTAFYIKVHDTDNVAIIVNDNGLKAGTRFPDGLTLVEHIPQGHKIALVDIPAHGEIDPLLASAEKTARAAAKTAIQDFYAASRSR